MLSSWNMNLARTLLTTVLVAVAIFGPALFMASSPCLDCDGVCGAAATVASVQVRTVVFVLSSVSESRAQIPSTPVRLSELPPRPLTTTA